jgi:hypothetical protein
MTKPNRTHKDSVWTPEVVAELKKSVSLGQSGSQIAGHLTLKFGMRFTRSSVIGRCHRQGMRLKPTVSVKTAKTLVLHTVSPPAFSLSMLPPRCCIWPSGDGPITFECRELAQRDRPYCEAHSKRAFVPWRPITI